MKTFEEFLAKIEKPEHQERVRNVLTTISEKYSNLAHEVKWNEPMFSDHGTFIIGFSVSKAHLAVSPETYTLNHFEEEIKASGYSRTKMLMRIKWTEEVDMDLIQQFIDFNIEDKKNYKKFWRDY